MRFKKSIALLFMFFVALMSCRNKPKNPKEELKDSLTTVSDSTIIFQNNSEKRKSEIADTSQHALSEIIKDFETYKKTVAKVTIDKGVKYILEGDEAYNEDKLFTYWLSAIYNKKTRSQADSTKARTRLIVETDLIGSPLIWPKGTILKFCIIKNTFPDEAKYQFVKENLIKAVQDWQKACNIKFQYHGEKDNLDDSLVLPDGLDFTVVYNTLSADDNPTLLALSFYRDDLTSKKLRVYPNYFANKIFNKAGVFRHELGHIMGFRHEFISPDAPRDCPKESIDNTKPVTQYDSNSVMHYLCGNFKNYDLIFTQKDIAGSQFLYGKPNH